MKVLTRVAVLLSVCLGLVSCDSKFSDESNSSEPDGGSKNKPELFVSGESRFLQEVGKEVFKEAESPAESPLFRWDFSKQGVTHEYTYKQEVRMEMDSGLFDPETQAMTAEGILVVRSQGDNTAELVIKDVIMKMSEGDSEAIEQKVPAVALQGMREDGVGPFGNHSQDLFLKILFTLPAERMALGETIKVPMRMPYHLNGSALIVKGQSEVMLTEYVSIDDRLCAKFDVETDISELNVPPEIEGEHAVAMRGRSVLYFDVGRRCFVNGTIALLMESSSDAPKPQFGQSPNNGADEPERLESSMVMDSLIKLRLKE